MRSRTEQLKQQMSGEVETCSEFFMASKIDAPEQCKTYSVAGFSLECECLDDDQGTKTQIFELECENGGKRDWCEEATMDGNGPVVETLAQDGSQTDREMQHERRVCHQRTSTQLCQNGLQRNLLESLEMSRTSMVEMETAPLERNGERRMVWPAPTAFQNLQVGGHGGGGGFQIHWKRRRFVGISSRTTWDGCILLKTV